MKILLVLLLATTWLPAFADEPFPIPAKSKKTVTEKTFSDDAETDLGRPRRKTSRQVGFFGIGPAFLGNMATSGTGYLLAGTYGWDLTDAIIKLNGETAFNGGAIWVNVGVGVQAYLFHWDHAPYVAADFGVTYARAESSPLIPRTVTGFSVGTQVGVQLFRTSDIQFDVGLRYAVLLKENPYGHPSLFSIKIGIWF